MGRREAGDRLLTGRFLVLCAGSLAYFLALGSTWPVIPSFVEHDLGGGGLAVGLSVGAFGFSAAILRPLIGPLGDRRGRRFLLVGGALVVSLSMLLLVPAASVPAVIGARLVLGVGEAAYFIGVTSAVQDLAPPHRRGEATSYFTVTLYTGLAIGPGLGEWLYETGSYDRAFIVAALLGLIPLLFAYAAPGRPADPFRGPLLRWRLHPAAIRPGLVLFMGLLGYSGFLAFIALHAESIGVSSSGLVFALFASIVVAVRLLGARIPDQLGSLATTRLSLGFSATGLAVFGLWTSPTGVYVGAVVMALGQCFLFPALFVLTVDRAPESERSHAIGSFSVAFDLAVGLGGFLVGGVVALTDRPGGFLFCSMVAVGSLLATGPLLGEIGATARSEAGQPT